jgi:hypothetical protein
MVKTIINEMVLKFYIKEFPEVGKYGFRFILTFFGLF